MSKEDEKEPRPYRGSYQQDLDDEDVDTQEPEPEEPQEENTEPESAEERSFKKRYGDLRRYVDKELKPQYEEKIQELEKKVNEVATRGVDMPTSEAELEDWMKKYPDVARVVRTIANKEAKKERETIDKKLKELEQQSTELTKKEVEAQLKEKHPDYQELRDSDDFHEWAEQQPQYIQDSLYRNTRNVTEISRAIDLYKLDRGITTKQRKREQNQTRRSAAAAVNTRSAPTEVSDNPNKPVFKESEIQQMSIQEFEEKAKDIEKAQREGRIEYDLAR